MGPISPPSVRPAPGDGALHPYILPRDRDPQDLISMIAGGAVRIEAIEGLSDRQEVPDLSGGMASRTTRWDGSFKSLRQFCQFFLRTWRKGGLSVCLVVTPISQVDCQSCDASYPRAASSRRRTTNSRSRLARNQPAFGPCLWPRKAR